LKNKENAIYRASDTLSILLFTWKTVTFAAHLLIFKPKRTSCPLAEGPSLNRAPGMVTFGENQSPVHTNRDHEQL
jgi:hypothetical protein